MQINRLMRCWYWQPATIKLGETHLQSAVHISNLKIALLLSIVPSDLLIDADPNIWATVSSNATDDELKWNKASIEYRHIVKEHLDLLKAVGSSFTSEPLGSLELVVFSCKFLPDPIRRLEVDEMGTGQDLRVYSSPFADANPVLLTGIQSSGVTSKILPNGLALCDMRYWAGMSGAVVTSGGTPKLLGLVVGSIARLRGEGRLTVVLPFPRHLPDDLSLVKAGLVSLQRNDVSFSEVVSVYSASRKGRSWGSGVLISPTVVVTNWHVVGEGSTNTVYSQHTEKPIECLDVARPVAGLDLAFLHLAEPLHNVANLAPADVSPGTDVFSVGFGLLGPQTKLPVEPLVSKGIIARVHTQQLLQSDPPDIGLLVTTAPSWNGSSGGGVFDAKTKSLVGILASNACDSKTGEIFPDMAFAIPVSLVKRCSTLAGSQGSIEACEDFRRLWKLVPTHKDIYPKL